MKKIFNLVLSALPFIITNCKEKERPVHLIDQETKDYCDFKTGSWWAYKEEKSGIIDTISVYNYERNIRSLDEAGYDYELISMYLKWSSFKHDLTKSNPNLRINSNPSSSGNDSKAFVTEQFPYFRYDLTDLFFPFEKVGEIFVRYDTLKLTNLTDSLELEGQKYFKVKDFEVSGTTFKHGLKRIVWAKNIGRIRFETYDGFVWNLIDHHVIQ